MKSDNMEFVLFFRKRRRGSKWDSLDNDFISKRKTTKEDSEQFEICEGILYEALDIAIDEYGISPDVFHDSMIIFTRRGEVVGNKDENDNWISYDEPEEIDEVK